MRNPSGAMSPAQPPRATRHVEQRVIVGVITTATTATSISSTNTADLAPFLSALDSLLDLPLGLDSGVSDSLLAVAPHQDTGDLDDADDAEEEVDGGEQVVLGLDDEAPAGPDDTRGRQGAVLLQGELLGRASEVGDTGDDEGPLHDGRPEVHRLEADGAVPHAPEPADLGGGLLLGADGGLPPAAPLLSLLAAEGLLEARGAGEGLSGLGSGRGGREERAGCPGEGGS